MSAYRFLSAVNYCKYTLAVPVIAGIKYASPFERTGIPGKQYMKRLPGNIHRTFFTDYGYFDLSGILHFFLDLVCDFEA